MVAPKSSSDRRGVREMLSGIRTVGCALVGGLLGLVLAFAWLIAVDVVTRGVVSWFEDIVGERGLILFMGAALALIGAVFPGPHPSQWPSTRAGTRPVAPRARL
jgi:hypothetical protein